MTARMTRGERAEVVRAEVLDAARQEFLAAGYHGASLDRIAAAAGYTKGAVYSRFTSKADLFLALLEDRIESRAAENEALASSLEGAAGVAELARRWTELQRSDLAWTLLVVEFRVHAARDPELGARYAELHERTILRLESVLQRVLGPTATSVRDLARALFAMGNGVSLEQAVDPAAFPLGDVRHHVTALVEAATEGGPR